MVAAGAIVLMVGGLVVWFIFQSSMNRQTARNDKDQCLLSGDVPESVLVLVDGTDPLAQANSARFRALIYRMSDLLPKNGRLVVASFDGEVGRSAQVEFDWCSPGKGEEADGVNEGRGGAKRRYEARFQKPLDRVIERLSTDRSGKFSPIVEKIEAAISDPAIPWDGQVRRLIVMTDGLQNTAERSIYRGDKVLPYPNKGLLGGVHVTFIELPSVRDSRFQTAEVRSAWEAWFAAAGASSVTMHAPGYARPAQ